MDERCENCKFIKFHGAAAGSHQCRRHAPVPYVEGRYSVLPMWPKVSEYDWCGDFELKEQSEEQ